MDFYEFKARGKVLVEVLNTLPPWKTNDIGRLIYDLNTNFLYVGGDSQWICTSPTLHSINSKHIDWDVLLDDKFGLKVNASHIPCRYIPIITDNNIWFPSTDISNVQDSILDLRNAASLILSGTYYADDSIKLRHIDTTSSERIDADDLLVNNRKLYFGDSSLTITVEDALEQLYNRRADDILMSSPNTFGNKLNIYTHTVQESFDAIESYLSTLTADQIYATTTPSDTECNSDPIKVSTVQCVLDQLHTELNNLRLIDLTDIEYEMKRGEMLKGCLNSENSIEFTSCEIRGSNLSAHWSTVSASEVVAIQPFSSEETTVQEVLWKIYNIIQSIRNDIAVINNDIVEMKKDIKKLMFEIILIQNDTVDLNNRFQKLRINYNELSDYIKHMQTIINNMNVDIMNLQNSITYIKEYCCDMYPECPPPEFYLSFYVDPLLSGDIIGKNNDEEIEIFTDSKQIENCSITLSVIETCDMIFDYWTGVDNVEITREPTYSFNMPDHNLTLIAKFLIPPLPTCELSLNCFCHITGGLFGGVSVGSTTKIFVEDKISNIIGAGDYPNMTIFNKTIATTLDGIALGSGTHIEFWSGPKFTGEKILDRSGPCVINNSKFASTHSHLNSDDYLDPELQIAFPQSVRFWSGLLVSTKYSDMHTWQKGSFKITCVCDEQPSTSLGKFIAMVFIGNSASYGDTWAISYPGPRGYYMSPYNDWGRPYVKDLADFKNTFDINNYNGALYSTNIEDSISLKEGGTPISRGVNFDLVTVPKVDLTLADLQGYFDKLLIDFKNISSEHIQGPDTVLVFWDDTAKSEKDEIILRAGDLMEPLKAYISSQCPNSNVALDKTSLSTSTKALKDKYYNRTNERWILIVKETLINFGNFV